MAILEIFCKRSWRQRALLAPLSREQALARPKPDDWNILEVIGHITDAEQIFAYRALRIARGDTTPLAGFEQDDYVRAAHCSDLPLDDLLDAYTAQRRATLALLRGFDADAWLRRGTGRRAILAARGHGHTPPPDTSCITLTISTPGMGFERETLREGTQRQVRG